MTTILLLQLIKNQGRMRERVSPVREILTNEEMLRESSESKIVL